MMKLTKESIPGLAVCLIGTAAAMLLNFFIPVVSALLAGILLGAIIANTIGVKTAWNPGVAYAGKRLLRVGIVLLGFQVSLTEIASLGLGMIGVVIAIVGLGIAGTLLIGRLLKTHIRQTLLIACGFSICGAAAVAAVDGVMETEEEEVATAIALVVLFGTLMIPLAPVAATAMGLSAHEAALWAGGAIHEVAQVVAAAGIIGPVDDAVIVKLARVLMLAPVMAFVSIIVAKHPSLQAPTSGGKRPPLVPAFVLGFIAMMLVTSTGWVPAGVLAGIKIVQTALLACAMFALGLGVKLSKLVAVGPKPLVLGALSTILVSAISLGGVLLAT